MKACESSPDVDLKIYHGEADHILVTDHLDYNADDDQDNDYGDDDDNDTYDR